MRSFTEFTAEKQLSESAIIAKAEQIRKEFLQFEAQIMRGQGIGPKIHADVNPQQGQIFLTKSGNNPQLYVIKSGSVFHGLEITSLAAYFQLQNLGANQPIPMKLARELEDSTKPIPPKELIKTQKVERDLLTPREQSLLAACNKTESPIWSNDVKLIQYRQKNADREERRRAAEAQAEKDRLHGLGVVTHQTPTVSGAEEDFMKKKLLGGATTEPKETPEELRRRVFGSSEPSSTIPNRRLIDDATIKQQADHLLNLPRFSAQSAITDIQNHANGKDPDGTYQHYNGWGIQDFQILLRLLGHSEPDRHVIRQRMGMQDMRDLMAQRQAKRDAGEVIPPSTRPPMRRRV